ALGGQTNWAVERFCGSIWLYLTVTESMSMTGKSMRILTFVLAAAGGVVSGGAALGQGALLPAPEEKPIRGLMFPAISPDGAQVCFSYLGDLWTVSSAGGRASRITVHEANDSYP